MAVLTAARGLVTSPSELTVPDGALRVADNAVIDYENTIQSRRGFNDYSGPAFPQVSRQLFTYKNRLLYQYGVSLAVDLLSSGAYSTFSGAYSELIAGLRLRGLEANGNFYFTSSTGIKKLSALTAADISVQTITDAGGVPANDLSAKVILDSSGYLLAQSKAAYRIVFGTKDNNNNLILGAPSSRVILTNQSADLNSNEVFTVNFLATATVVSGDYWLFSTPSGGYFVWYDLTGLASAPVNADTLDRVGIRVNLQGVVAPTATQFASYTANALSTNTEVQVELSGTEISVTVANPGDVSDVAQGSLLATEILTTKVADGSTTTGSPAYAELNFSLPERLTTNYFYQVYRTGVVTVGLSQTLNDIDPGDEQYFVFENPITSADLLAGEITVTDNTPETFRQSGAPLYTNALTGDGTRGILEANNIPPIAHDMALFRNSTFYSNTKDFHRYNMTLLSVDDFVSGSTKLSIAQASKFVQYTFVGVAQVAQVTVVARSGTVSGSYITLSSANNDRNYYIWFDTGASTDPAIPNALGIRIPLSLYDDTLAGSKQALIDALGLISDFTATDTGAAQVTVTWTNSGASTAPVSASTWAISVTVPGDGEDALAKEVLLSLSPSIGIAIDETARSLVKVINRDVDSPVTATYLSSNEDLPGKILLEAKTQEDVQFYVAINSAALSAEFNPALPATYTITSISTVGNLFTTSAPHLLVPGAKVYVNDTPGLTPTQFAGQFTIATVPSGTTFTLLGQTVSINQPAISGVVFASSVAASDNNTNPNRLAFSKISQPEAVPTPNYIDVGSKDKAILRILALRDNLFCLKEDGIYIVTGSSAPDFSVRLLDNSAICIAPDSAVVLNNLIYVLTTQGVVSISESGVSIVSRPIEDQIKKVTTFNYQFKYTSFGLAYESDRSYLLWLPEKTSDTVATQCYRYNTITNTWTRWTKSNTCGIVNYLGDDRMYLGVAERSVIEQERKNGERQDYSDRNFTRSLGVNAFDGVSVTLSSTAGVTVGDVITQSQYATVTKYNRLLSKLDRDTGTSFKDYRSSLQLSVGANLSNGIAALVSKLNLDPNLSGAFSAPSGSNALLNLQADYNTLIGELNDSGSGTSLKDYKLVTDLLTYEVLITEVAKTGNLVTVNFSTWFIQGNIEVYKGIKTVVEWQPQDFGKPEEFKQIPSGTLIFDQGTIYSGTIAYASDRSADFAEIPFTMSGPGFWVSYPWLDSIWGGSSNSAPKRTLVPQNKARCRFLAVRFTHVNAREQYKLLGISLDPRPFSTRAYR